MHRPRNRTVRRNPWRSADPGRVRAWLTSGGRRRSSPAPRRGSGARPAKALADAGATVAAARRERRAWARARPRRRVAPTRISTCPTPRRGARSTAPSTSSTCCTSTPASTTPSWPTSRPISDARYRAYTGVNIDGVFFGLRRGDPAARAGERRGGGDVVDGGDHAAAREPALRADQVEPHRTGPQHPRRARTARHPHQRAVPGRGRDPAHGRRPPWLVRGEGHRRVRTRGPRGDGGRSARLRSQRRGGAAPPAVAAGGVRVRRGCPAH